MTDAPEHARSVDNIHGLMKKLKILEEFRIKTFKNWQYSDKENCSVKKVCFEKYSKRKNNFDNDLAQMAEAGFYYSGADADDDSATCFVCGKVLDGWENDDEPWTEHEKHAPRCQFVQIHSAQEELSVRSCSC